MPEDYREGPVGNYLPKGPRGILEYNLSGEREMEHPHLLQDNGAVTGGCSDSEHSLGKVQECLMALLS